MMMDDSHFQTRYQPLRGPQQNSLLEDVPEHGRTSSPGLLHTVPDRARRWRHISDLDNFLRNVYKYHQSGGFKVLMLEQLLHILMLVFMVVLLLFLMCGLKYELLFSSETVNNTTMHVEHISLYDGMYSVSETLANMSFYHWLLVIAGLFALGYRIFMATKLAFQFWDIREFFINALMIPDHTLQNVTWEDIKKQLLEVQLVQRMCVHKDILTSLDIYQRIVLHQNYLIAFVNQNVIPVRFNIPLWGEVIHFTKSYEDNLKHILFSGNNSFLSSINIDELRQTSVKAEKIKQLEKYITFMAVVNGLMTPVLFIYQLLFLLFTYVQRLKNEPGSLASRCWSHYGRLYVRHYNELDHELNARLNRAYTPSLKYITRFTSHSTTIIAGFLSFMFGAIFCSFVLLSFIDNDFLSVENVPLIIAGSLAIATVAEKLKPEENVVWRPDLLMDTIVKQIHYLPESWNGKFHTTQVRDEFSQLFQYKFMHIVEEIMSPLVTPFILYFCVRPRAKAIVDFFHMFTVHVEGIGNACSFAQMDVQQHGTPAWQPKPPRRRDDEAEAAATPNHAAPDWGRTELSLLQFAYTNPDWQPPKAGLAFINAVRQHQHEVLPALPESLNYTHSLSSVYLGELDRNNPYWQNPAAPAVPPSQLQQQQQQHPLMDSNNTVRGAHGTDNPFLGSSVFSGPRSLQQEASMRQSSQYMASSVNHSAMQPDYDSLLPMRPRNAYDMGNSCLFLRHLSLKNRTHGQYLDGAPPTATLEHSERANRDLDAEVAMYQMGPADNGDSFAQHDRLYQRSPSPPAVDPFQDAMMSQMGSIQSEAMSTQYQGIMYDASHVMQQQQQQQRRPGEDPSGRSIGDDTPLLQHPQR